MDQQYSLQFFTCLVEAMQKFCRDYIDFDQVVELSGYLSLEIDNYKKERYVLSEMVHSTGDVISESYCVKAFKTMKQTVDPKAHLPCKTLRNIHVGSERMDSGMFTYNKENLKETLSQDWSHISMRHQTICSGHSGDTNPPEPPVKSPAFHSSSVKVSAAEDICPSIPSDPGESEAVLHDLYQNHIQPTKSLQLLETESTRLPVNPRLSCTELINPNCNQSNQRLEIVSTSEINNISNEKIREIRRNSPVTDISIECKIERMVGDESMPLNTDEESSDVLHHSSLQFYSHTTGLKNIQLKEEDEIICLDDVDNHTDIDKHFNVEQKTFHMDTSIYLDHSTVSETSRAARTNSKLDPNISNYEGNLSENASFQRHLSKLSGRDKHSTHGILHKCDQCNYKTLYTTHLRNHQKIHTREFFPCHLCPRKFADNSQLVYHLKIHAGRLTCSVCKKRFPSLKMMKLHQHLHTDGKT